MEMGMGMEEVVQMAYPVYLEMVASPSFHSPAASYP